MLRVQVEYVSGMEPCTLFFEVASTDRPEFVLVASVESSLWSLADPDEESADEAAGYPQVWRSEFRHMASRWAAAAWVLDFGCSVDLESPSPPATGAVAGPGRA